MLFAGQLLKSIGRVYFEQQCDLREQHFYFEDQSIKPPCTWPRVFQGTCLSCVTGNGVSWSQWLRLFTECVFEQQREFKFWTATTALTSHVRGIGMSIFQNTIAWISLCNSHKLKNFNTWAAPILKCIEISFWTAMRPCEQLSQSPDHVHRRFSVQAHDAYPSALTRLRHIVLVLPGLPSVVENYKAPAAETGRSCAKFCSV